MKKIIYALFAFAVVAFFAVACSNSGDEISAPTPTPTPPGEEFPLTDYDDSYIFIASAEDLQKIGADENFPLDGNYALSGAIDLSTLEMDWTPIGTYAAPFTGKFDGRGKVISQLSITSSTSDSSGNYKALFAAITSAEIKNVIVENPQILAHDNVAAVVGYANQSHIEACESREGEISGSNKVAGIVGYAVNTTVALCRNTSKVMGIDSSAIVGGITGTAATATVIFCNNEGVVMSTGANSDVGGIVGAAAQFTSGTLSTIIACRNTANVSSTGGDSSVGGIVGEMIYTQLIANLNESSVGGVSSRVGAIVGKSTNHVFTSNYYSDSVAGAPEQGLGTSITDHIALVAASNLNTDEVITAINQEICNYGNGYYDGAKLLYGYKLSGEAEATAPLFTKDVAFVSKYPFADVDGVYQIKTAEQMYNISQISAYYTKDYKLLANINLNGSEERQWTPIGKPNINETYKGTFDGGGHTVSGVYINANKTNDEGSYQSFIGHTYGATIKNLKLENPKVTGYNYVSALVSVADASAVIENCAITGDKGQIIGSKNVAGIVGYAKTLSINDCYNTAEVNGSGQYTGGVAGQLENSSAIRNCYNTGSINASGGSTYLGGVVGSLSSSDAYACYNTGAVSMTREQAAVSLGGVFGGASYSEILACYNTGTVTAKAANDRIGGVLGSSLVVEMTSCFNSGTINRVGTTVYAGGLIGLTNNSAELSNCYIKENDPNYIVGFTNLVADLNAADVVRGLNIGISNKGKDYFDGQKLFKGFVATSGSAPQFANNIDFVGNLPYPNSQGVYEIKTSEQMKNIHLVANYLKNNYILMADVDLGGEAEPWSPIGTFDTIGLTEDETSFTGTFDGDDYTISGLYIDHTAEEDKRKYTALFGNAYGATIKNVKIKNPIVKGVNYAAGLVARTTNDTKIINCAITGGKGLITGEDNVAGLISLAVYGDTDVIACYNTAEIVGTSTEYRDVAGLIAYGYYRKVVGCFNTGIVRAASGSPDDAGGLFGQGGSNITACFYDNDVENAPNYALSGFKEPSTPEGTKGVSNINDIEVIAAMNLAISELGQEYFDGENLLYGFELNQTAGATEPIASRNFKYAADLPTLNSNGIYEIKTTNQMKNIVYIPDYLNQSYLLTADIDLDGSSLNPWEPIGQAYHNPFKGNFDGGGFTIRGLYSGRGIFIYTQDATIKNLTIENAQIIGGDYVAALVSISGSGTLIENCAIVGSQTVITGNEDVGSIIGVAAGTTLKDSYSTVDVKGANYWGDNFGGLIGRINDNGSSDLPYTVLSNVYYTGEVHGPERRGSYVGPSDVTCNLGGLVGRAGKMKMNDSYCTGLVYCDGDNVCMGGLVGEVKNSEITDSYSSSTLIMETRKSYLGGLFGKLHNSKMNECYHNGKFNLEAGSSGTIIGGLVGEFMDSEMYLCKNTGPLHAVGYIDGYYVTFTDEAFIGGLVGVTTGNSTFTACSHNGNIYSGGSKGGVGGLAGKAQYGSLFILCGAITSFHVKTIEVSHDYILKTVVGGLVGHHERSSDDDRVEYAACYSVVDFKNNTVGTLNEDLTTYLPASGTVVSGYTGHGKFGAWAEPLINHTLCEYARETSPTPDWYKGDTAHISVEYSAALGGPVITTKPYTYDPDFSVTDY